MIYCYINILKEGSNMAKISCSKCNGTISKIQNYGTDASPLCFECSSSKEAICPQTQEPSLVDSKSLDASKKEFVIVLKIILNICLVLLGSIAIFALVRYGLSSWVSNYNEIHINTTNLEEVRKASLSSGFMYFAVYSTLTIIFLVIVRKIIQKGKREIGKL